MEEIMKKQKGITTMQIILIIIALIIIMAIGIAIIKENKKVDENKEENIIKQTENEEYVSKLENGTTINTSSKLVEEKEVAGLQVSGIQLTRNETWSTIIATVKNNGNTENGNFMVQVDVKDKNGKIITILQGYIGKVESGENTQLNVSTMEDISNAYDINIRKK